MTPIVTAAHLALAETLADAAGEIIRGYFRKKIGVQQKSDRTPVTIADRAAEKVMRRLIEIAFPQHGIFGEEFGKQNADADYVWVLDPIDGTKSFITGVPTFGTLISLAYRGQPVLGIIDQPIARERWVGAIGRKSTFNGKTIKTRACGTLAEATLSTTSPDLFRKAELAAFERLRRRVKLTRYGNDCYAYALVASGFIDLVVEADLKPYDFCALVPVIEGAGGSLTDWRGHALDFGSDGRVVASGDKTLARKALRVLAQR
jgi:inositol-phosphate phosphatase / L-galactose 1-phosphate phosphatase / histidinol-phosphatase